MNTTLPEHPCYLKFPAGITENQPLAPRCYYGLGGRARYFSEPQSALQVAALFRWATLHNLPVAVLGTGSNLAFADETFDGLVICLQAMNKWHWCGGDLLWAEAGVTNTEIAEAALDACAPGASWMFRMPGSLGGTVRMNARCFGGEISEITWGVQSVDKRGDLHFRKADEIFKGYKDTFFMKSAEIVTGCWLKLRPHSGQESALLTHMQQCEAQRLQKHHFDFPSCGSTFKNNYHVGRPSGQIFDELGLKGTRQGGLGVSPHHGNFIFNYGQGTTTDLLLLTSFMRDKAIGIQADLELEVQPIGAFSKGTVTSCALDRQAGTVPDSEKQDTFWVGLVSSQNDFCGHKSFPKKVFSAPFSCYFDDDTHPPHTNPQNAGGQGRRGRVSDVYMGRTQVSDEEPNDARPHFQDWYHLSEVQCELLQLRSLHEARLQPELPFLAWKTICPKEYQPHLFQTSPDLPKGTFTDHLWQFCVSELFLAHPQAPHCYLEFEMTPAQHWLALAFYGVRQRRKEHEKPCQELWPQVQPFADAQGWGLLLPYGAVASVIDDAGCLLTQGCLSLGGKKTYLAPSWNLTQEHKKTESADFHQPLRYWPTTLFVTAPV